MSDPVQCVVSYPPLPFFAVSVQAASGFPVTLPEAPAPEVETNDPVSVSVMFVNGSPAQVIVLPATGPQGPDGANAEHVVLTLSEYLALSPASQMDGRWYLVPKT